VSSEITCPHCHHAIELSVQAKTVQLDTPSIPIKLTPRVYSRVSTPSIPVFVTFPPDFQRVLVRSIPPTITELISERESSARPVAVIRSVAPKAPSAPVISIVPEAPTPVKSPVCSADVSLEVTPDSDHNFYVGFSANISEGGLFVATYTRKEVGEVVSIQFTLPGDDEPITALTEVRWVREYNETSDVGAGLGLSFVEISDAAKARIHAFCQTAREPLFYPEDSLYPPKAKTG
jgi:uncharacterized protein (TIGR02266 family)